MGCRICGLWVQLRQLPVPSDSSSQATLHSSAKPMGAGAVAPFPICSASTCDEAILGTMTDGTISVDTGSPNVRPVGAIASSVCNPGYRIQGSPTSFTCQADGSWTSAALPVCLMSCDESAVSIVVDGTLVFPTPAQGTLHDIGAQATWTCAANTIMSGSATIDCQADGSWTANPTCVAACDETAVATVTDGSSTFPTPAQGTLHAVGAQATWSCAAGKLLSGSITIDCQVDGTWTANPTCDMSCDESAVATISDGTLTFPSAGTRKLARCRSSSYAGPVPVTRFPTAPQKSPVNPTAAGLQIQPATWHVTSPLSLLSLMDLQHSQLLHRVHFMPWELKQPGLVSPIFLSAVLPQSTA